VPPGIDDYGAPVAAEEEAPSPIDNEERAKALLADAGYGPGKKPLKVELRFNTSDNNRNTAIAIASMWRAVGVETSLINMDAKTHFAHLRDGGDFDVARYGWIGDYPDPQTFLFLLESRNKGFNAGRWSNPDYDALMRRAETELDPAARAALLRQAETIVVRELPWIPVLFYGTKNLISPKLHGFRQNPLGVAPTRFLWLEP
jgi:oligopeptide transport system substrate-binding protein